MKKILKISLLTSLLFAFGFVSQAIALNSSTVFNDSKHPYFGIGGGFHHSYTKAHITEFPVSAPSRNANVRNGNQYSAEKHQLQGHDNHGGEQGGGHDSRGEGNGEGQGNGHGHGHDKDHGGDNSGSGDNADGGNTNGGGSSTDNTDGENTNGGGGSSNNADGGSTNGGGGSGDNADGGSTNGGGSSGDNTDGGNTNGGGGSGDNTDGGNTNGGGGSGDNTDGGNTNGGGGSGDNTDGGNTNGGGSSSANGGGENYDGGGDNGHDSHSTDNNGGGQNYDGGGDAQHHENWFHIDWSKSKSFTQDNNGVLGIIFMGYHIPLPHRFFTNLETFATINSLCAKHRTIGPLHLMRMGMQSSVGFSINPGIFLSPTTQLFTRVGFSGGQFAAVFDNAHSVHRTLLGGILGVGIETAISPSFGLRGEFDHGWYSRYTRHVTNALTEYYKPSTDQLWIALVIYS